MLQRSLPRIVVAFVVVALIVLLPVLPGRAAHRSSKSVLHTNTGRNVGTVRFIQYDGYTLVKIAAQNLPPGFYGLHVHETGQCAGPEFASAGSHWNPAGAQHPHHVGDLVPVVVMSNGTGIMDYRIDAFTVHDLFDSDGSAVVLHAQPDNFANVPPRYHSHDPDDSSTTFGPDTTTLLAGDSGTRLACAVVKTK